MKTDDAIDLVLAAKVVDAAVGNLLLCSQPPVASKLVDAVAAVAVGKLLTFISYCSDLGFLFSFTGLVISRAFLGLCSKDYK